MIEIYKKYSFDSAHYLPKVPKEHKCASLHGHTYTLIITVSGKIDERGFIIDYQDMDTLIKPIVNYVDHKLLNDIVDNPTSENLTIYFAKELKDLKNILKSVEVKETQNTGAIWRNNELFTF
jgi:6-pyruvoyltetrahydropterin/6-carboxytetrahydropterin synthase